MCSIKKNVFLKILKKPQVCNFIKKKTLAQVFSCEFFDIFKGRFFIELLRVSASDCSPPSGILDYIFLRC